MIYTDINKGLKSEPFVIAAHRSKTIRYELAVAAKMSLATQRVKKCQGQTV
jgi:hypothetical protein